MALKSTVICVTGEVQVLEKTTSAVVNHIYELQILQKAILPIYYNSHDYSGVRRLCIPVNKNKLLSYSQM